MRISALTTEMDVVLTFLCQLEPLVCILDHVAITLFPKYRWKVLTYLVEVWSICIWRVSLICCCSSNVRCVLRNWFDWKSFCKLLYGEGCSQLWFVYIQTRYLRLISKFSAVEGLLSLSFLIWDFSRQVRRRYSSRPTHAQFLEIFQTKCVGDAPPFARAPPKSTFPHRRCYRPLNG